MRKRYQVYKCEVCGNIVQVLHGGVGSMICCNRPMKLLDEQTKEAGSEKHVPIIEQTNDGILVKVGSIQHPMDPDHYIEWIEVISGDKIYRKHLEPGMAPEVNFKIDGNESIAREYCTVHGMWRS